MKSIPVIVIIDDSVITRRIVKNIVNGKVKNSIVYTFSSGSDLIENYQQINPDVIILDNLFPITETRAETGKDILTEIRELDRNVRVIIYSAQCDTSVIDELKALGADAYITKPAAAETLGEVIIENINRCSVNNDMFESIKSFERSDDEIHGY